MNWEHLKAILWLRWRLTRNQWQRAGAVSAGLMMIFFILMLVLAAVSFFVAIVAGCILLPQASPLQILIAWDVLVVVFLFAWSMSLLIDIQRSEMLSLDKLLQLPVSLKSAFLMNYCSSLLSLSAICFFPAAIGFSLAHVLTFGLELLLLVPLVCSFLLMVTALTYQLRGWLASLMSNKRRQRSVVTGITLGFVALSQLPNIIIQLTVSDSNQTRVAHQAELNQLSLELAGHEVTIEEHNQQVKELNDKFNKLRAETETRKMLLVEKCLTTANQFIPFGWLPYGGNSLLNGHFGTAVLSLIGMTGIGFISLWYGYLATLRYYTGASSSHPFPLLMQKGAGTWGGKLNSAARLTVHGGAKRELKPMVNRSKLERSVSCLSEQSSAVALCSFYNFTRAPEAKMLLIAPLIFGGMIAMMLITKKMPQLPTGTEAYLMLGGLAIVMFISMTLLSNSFGYDRSGFRSYVLMPADRREILIGKNAGVFPFVGSMAAFELAATSFLAPVRTSDLVASALQTVIMFLTACLIGNTVSIYFPMVVAGGTGKPVQPNIKTMLAQMLAMTLVPMALVPGAIAISLELALNRFLNIHFVPLYLLLSLVEVVAMWWLYIQLIGVQGKWLAARETRILQLLAAHLE